MKHIIVLCLLLAASSLFALDGVLAGLGVEANANTREGTAFGGGVTGGFHLNENMAVGAKVFFSSNFDTVTALEPAAFFRYYLPVAGLFVQAEAGMSVFFEDGDSYPTFLAGASVGYRFVFNEKFFVDPVVRGGYPFAWGVGVTAGLILGGKE